MCRIQDLKECMKTLLPVGHHPSGAINQAFKEQLIGAFDSSRQITFVIEVILDRDTCMYEISHHAKAFKGHKKSYEQSKIAHIFAIISILKYYRINFIFNLDFLI